MSEAAFFRNATFTFLKDLKSHNDRDWFKAQKQRYEDEVVEPAFAFIEAFGSRLRRISPHFNAIPKKTGGSLFRIHRDTRFAKDKSPYKTHVGIHFRHKKHRDAHAPGFYLHLEPAGSFMAAGIWHPDPASLRKIRSQLVSTPQRWREAVGEPRFKRRLKLAGDSLSRPPRGFDREHELIEDIKRKDFIATTELSQKTVISGQLLEHYTELCEDAAPLVAFLCRALDVPF